MKVYLTPPQPSRGLDRIAGALRRYAPATVEIVYSALDADLTIIYAIGRRDAIERQVRDILARSKQYAIVQVCLRSTMSPSTFDWMPVWEKAIVVWSYYDLERAFVDDLAEGEHNWGFWPLTNFYHAPLGVDTSIFHPRHEKVVSVKTGQPRNYIILSSGDSRLSESVRECYLAARAVGRNSCHLGPRMRMKDVDYFSDLEDIRLAQLYALCEFVSGLRRTEGFELPAAEGLLCGTRPICFDTPDYRWNYREFAEYIAEGTRAEVVDQLVELFKRGSRPVGDAELTEARHWFNWERICGEFWDRCLR